MIDSSEPRVRTEAPPRRWIIDLIVLLAAIALMALFAAVTLGLAVRLFRLTAGI